MKSVTYNIIYIVQKLHTFYNSLTNSYPHLFKKTWNDVNHLLKKQI